MVAQWARLQKPWAHQQIAARIQAPKAPPGAGAAPRGGGMLGGVDGSIDKKLTLFGSID